MTRRTHIRLTGACLILSLLMTLVPAAPAHAQTGPTFSVSGTGFGHGIGMSQYGAQGAAIAGKDFRWILAHYYTGTTVESAPAKDVRVNLDAAANYASGGNAGFTKTSWRIKPGQSGQRIIVSGISAALQTDGTYTFTGNGSSVVVTGPGISATTLTGTVRVTVSGGNPALLQVVEGTGIYSLANARYRGEMQLSASGGRIKLINKLPLESYLYGVVPREMPSSWRSEALKAQAVGARSYAYPSTGELYTTVSSQAYQGYGGYNSNGVPVGEQTSTNNAVDETTGLIVKYGSRIVRTYFFSHSGGHTANVEDVWVPGTGSAEELAKKAAEFPELRGVPDTYEYLANPPYAPWPPSKEASFTGLQLADKLRGLTGVPASPAYVNGLSVERAASGHARFVTFRFSNGATARISGSTVRSRLGLLSSNFHFSGFPMTRIQGPNRYATAQAISARTFPSTAPAAVIASGEDFADALAGSALAGAVAGPLLLTSKTHLPAVTAEELARLKPATVYILGGQAAVGDAVAGAIRRGLPDAHLVRIAGADRYDTARRIADFVSANGGAPAAIIANGRSWPDAASASALAYARKTPILLTPAGSLDARTEAFLESKRPSTVLLVGGTTVLSASVESSAAAAAGSLPRRLSGSDRYETSAAIARYTLTTAPAFSAVDVYVATGVEYADALAGGVIAGARRRPLLLTHTDRAPAGTAGLLGEYRSTTTRLYLLGGSAAISEKGADALDRVMLR